MAASIDSVKQGDELQCLYVEGRAIQRALAVLFSHLTPCLRADLLLDSGIKSWRILEEI
jgi:hypothetical protein